MSETASAEEVRETVNHTMLAQLALVTGGLAPEPYAKAWWDWYLSAAGSPSTQWQLAQSAWNKALDTWQFALTAAGGNAAAPNQDKRFAGEAWSQWPFNLYAKAYQNWEGWVREAVNSPQTLESRSRQLMEFMGQHMIDAASPTNYLHMNPELVEQTRAESGQNLIRGYQNWLEDVRRMLDREPPVGSDTFVVGRDVAVTRGKVVLRNDLIELIQYAPLTSSVHAEPILITAPWIMKYYILDLTPAKSLVRFLVEQGHTVFITSWKNPTSVDRNLGMDDYLQLGFRDALDAVTAIVPDQKVHMTGYCLGGTLNTIGLAALIREGDKRFATLSLFTALTDFAEPGELSIFIDPAQVAMLDAAMSHKGVLESQQMASAFQLLRSYDLLWAPAVNTYVRGERNRLNELMAWNADGTRMPRRMHSEYLNWLYLENRLIKNQYEVDGKPISLSAIELPVFNLGTESDHVAPWRTVYQTRTHTNSRDFTFLLTSGGHNAGIVSGPQNPKRRYRVVTWKDATTNPSADDWLANTPIKQGSWWPVWQKWLSRHSSRKRIAPPRMGNPALGYWSAVDAPGEYVHIK